MRRMIIDNRCQQDKTACRCLDCTDRQSQREVFSGLIDLILSSTNPRVLIDAIAALTSVEIRHLR